MTTYKTLCLDVVVITVVLTSLQSLEPSTSRNMTLATSLLILAFLTSSLSEIRHAEVNHVPNFAHYGVPNYAK
jgi:hypothetical protein